MDAHVSRILTLERQKVLPGNYRPVSLTSIICKVVELLVQDHVHHMISNQLLTDNQHSFIHGCSCATNPLAVIGVWTEATDMGLAVDAIYLDFTNAFDMVPH